MSRLDEGLVGPSGERQAGQVQAHALRLVQRDAHVLDEVLGEESGSAQSSQISKQDPQDDAERTV